MTTLVQQTDFQKFFRRFRFHSIIVFLTKTRFQNFGIFEISRVFLFVLSCCVSKHVFLDTPSIYCKKQTGFSNIFYISSASTFSKICSASFENTIQLGISKYKTARTRYVTFISPLTQAKDIPIQNYFSHILFWTRVKKEIFVSKTFSEPKFQYKLQFIILTSILK